MLHAIASKEFDAAVIQLHGNVDGQFAGGIAQHLANAFIQAKLVGCIVKAGFCCQPRIFLLIGSHGCRHCGSLSQYYERLHDGLASAEAHPPAAAHRLQKRRRIHHGIQCLPDLRIALHLDFVALGDAQRQVENIFLQTGLDEVFRLQPFAQAGLNLSFAQPQLKLIHHRLCDLPVRRDFVIADVLGGEGRKRSRGLKHFLKLSQPRRMNDNVRQ